METQFNTSIWGDEGFSAILSMKSIPDIVKTIAEDTSPPLFNITEHIAFKLFGTDETVIRGLAFFYYLIAIFFVYLIGKHLWDKRTGLIAAALSFLNPFFFIYAFEGRMYSIMAAGVAASMYFFLKRQWIGYIIATAWALYSHHFAIFIVFVQGLLFIYEFFFGKRKDAIGMLKGFIGTFILYIPWLIPLYNQTTKVGGGFWLSTPSWNDLKTLIYEYLAEGIDHPLARPSLIVVFALLVLRLWGKTPKKTITMLLWFLLPILITFGISQVFQSVFYNRYLLYTIPAAMLVIASNRRAFSTTLLIILIGFFVVIDFHYFTHPTKKPFREYAAYVKENLRGDDFMIQGDAGRHHLWEAKYYGIPAPIYVPSEDDPPFFVGTALMEYSDIIRELPADANRIAVIISGNVDDYTLPGYTKDEVVEFPQDLKLVWFVNNK